MSEFLQTYSLPVPPSVIFDWYKQPGAFARLAPPWRTVQVVQRQGKGIQNGARVAVQVSLGGIKRILWIEHRDYLEGKQFKDVQIKGPFAKWEHTHLLEERPGQQTELKEKIEYEWPRFLRYAWLDRLFQRELERIFNYRAAVTKNDLLHWQGKKPLKILLTGASGLVGTSLLPFLTTGGHRVYKLVRKSTRLATNEIAWDPGGTAFNLHC